jgi:hypothetical protein
LGHFIVMVFFVGDVLMSARLILVGLLAVIDRLAQASRADLGLRRPSLCWCRPTTKRQ